MLPRLLEPNAGFSFELTGDCGAVLATKYPTYREDALSESTFESYTKRHYESWVTFSRYTGYGEDVQPILVSGFNMARSFAMVAYLTDGASLESNLGTAAPMAALHFNPMGWRTNCLAHTNSGPWQRNPDFVSSQPVDARDESNQCIFIRYYTRDRRNWILPMMAPKVIRVGGGAHNLDSGGDRWDVFPQLTVWPNAEPAVSSDGDSGGQCGSTVGFTDSEIDVRHTPHV